MKLALTAALALSIVGCAAAAALPSQAPDAQKLWLCVSNDVAKKTPAAQIIVDCDQQEAVAVVDIIADIFLALGGPPPAGHPSLADPRVQVALAAKQSSAPK